jgi:hypothetical protein
LGYGFSSLCTQFVRSGRATFEATQAPKGHGSGIFGEWLSYCFLGHTKGILEFIFPA